jgi:ER lumen protein retaining receptor
VSNSCVLTLDIFWTFSNSYYNSIYKIVFVASSAYIVYLMLNDFKPTHDPNIDTFKVQYLLGGSAVLAILVPRMYTPSEVQYIR